MIDTAERHAAYDAPNPEEFARLYSATFLQEDDLETRLEDRFITVGSGRLTLRKGALLHFHPGWLDRERKLIMVPHFEECSCTYCIERAEDYAENNDVSVEEALELCWSPKTEAGVRAIYYGWSMQTINAVEEFADLVGELDMDASTVNRRVDKLIKRAGVRENIYPHALRASSALFWADLGLEAAYLQAIMGWKSIEVAVAYLRASGHGRSRCRSGKILRRGRTLRRGPKGGPIPPHHYFYLCEWGCFVAVSSQIPGSVFKQTSYYQITYRHSCTDSDS